MKNDFIELQDIYYKNNDSSSIGRFYLQKELSAKNIFISTRLCETRCYKNIGRDYELVFDFGSPSKPFYLTRISLTIKSDYSYNIEMDCNTDVEDEVIKFNSIKKKCKYGVLHLTDSIFNKLNVISGFLNIEVYKDEELKELDYTSCLSFSTQLQNAPQ